MFDVLSQRPPDDDAGDGISLFYASHNPEIKVDKLVQFAMGIFWKASVHSWSGTSKIFRIELGPYSDHIRRWLKKETEFPKHVYLSAVVARPSVAQIFLLEPYETPATGWHTYMLHVPGLLFMLDIGKTVEASTRCMSLIHNPLKPLPVYDKIFGEVAQVMADAIRRSRKTQAFERAMQKAALVRNAKK